MAAAEAEVIGREQRAAAEAVAAAAAAAAAVAVAGAQGGVQAGAQGGVQAGVQGGVQGGAHGGAVGAEAGFVAEELRAARARLAESREGQERAESDSRLAAQATEQVRA